MESTASGTAAAMAIATENASALALEITESLDLAKARALASEAPAPAPLVHSLVVPCLLHAALAAWVIFFVFGKSEVAEHKAFRGGSAPSRGKKRRKESTARESKAEVGQGEKSRRVMHGEQHGRRRTSLANTTDSNILEMMYTGRQAESRYWCKEERAVLEGIRARLGSEVYRLAENYPSLLQRHVRGFWSKHTDEARAEALAESVGDIMQWRLDERVDSILTDGLLERHEDYHQAWPATIYGCDKYGHPILAERLADINVEALIDGLGKDLVVKHRVQVFESMTRWKEACSNQVGRRVYKQISILDLSDCALGEHFNPAGKAFLNTLIAVADKRYPETLHRFFIINAPYFFRVIWNLISAWIDPATRTKVQILGSDSKALQKVFAREHMPLASVPTWLGGSHSGYAMRTVVESFVLNKPFHAPEVAWAPASPEEALSAIPVEEVEESVPMEQQSREAPRGTEGTAPPVST